MTCPKCGVENHPQAATCWSCSAPLSAQPWQQYPAYYQVPQPAPRTRAHTGLIVCAVMGAVLVVLAGILAVSAAVTFPTFAKARDKARQTTCLHNMRMQQTAVLSYCADWGDTYPHPDRWCDQVSRYVLSADLYKCPSANASGRCDYGMNSAFRLPGGAPLRIADFASPAEAVMLFESRAGWNGSGGAANVEARHNDGANFGYADGHVKWNTRSRIPSLTWDPRRPRP